MTPEITVIMIFLLASFVIAWSHRHNTLKQIILNDNKTGTVLLTITLVATYVGGGLTTGIIHFGYQGGVIGIIIGLSYSLAFLFLGWLSGTIKILGDKHGYVSFSDFIEQTHGSLSSRIVKVIYFVVFIIFLAAQFVAFATVLRILFGYPFIWTVAIGALFVVAYTAISGFRGVLLTDTLQLAVLAIILFFFILPTTLEGGLYKFSTLPDNYLDGMAMGPTFAVGSLLFAGLTLFVRIDAWQRILAARDAKTARRAFVWTGIIILPFFAGFTLIGMDAYAFNPNLTTDGEVIREIFNHYFTNKWALSFVALGFVAAIVSSADSLLNVLAVNTVRDWPRLRSSWNTLEESGWSDQNANRILKRNVRLFTLAIGLMGLVLALLVPNLILLIIGGTSGLLVFLPMTLGGLIIRQPQPIAGILSVVLGMVVLISLVWTMPTLAFVPALVVATATYLIVHIIKRAK